MAVKPERPRQAVILAGGRGTRLRPLTDTRPKPMIEFHGKPFLGYVVELLREQGFERILLLLGYLPEVVIDHFGGGSRYGVRIDYDITGADDLTAHRVHHARDRIDDIFLLLYCDHYWPMRFDDLWSAYLASRAPVQVTVYANRDGYARDTVRVGADGFVEIFDRSGRTPGLRGVEIGYAIVRKDVILGLLPQHQEPFEQAVYPPLAESRLLHAFWTERHYYSAGELERIPLTEAFLERLSSRQAAPTAPATSLAQGSNR